MKTITYQLLHIRNYCNLMGIYIPYTSLSITVMFTFYSYFYISLHCFVAKFLIQMFKNMHGFK